LFGFNASCKWPPLAASIRRPERFTVSNLGHDRYAYLILILQKDHTLKTPPDETRPRTKEVAMSISRKLKDYLDSHKVQYEVLAHQEAYRAPEVAHALDAPEKEMAKVVIVRVEERSVMTVLPANWKVDLHRLRDVFLSNLVRLATEQEFKDLFPDCDVGAMPPFGNLYGLDVYVDRSLTEDDRIVFQAGTHSEAIRMRYADFADLVHPRVAEFHQSPSSVS
jgi:Ala-tRNA(Pro) deacylase